MSSSSTWSDEEIDWIRRRWPEDGTPELAKEHIELFGFMRSEYALGSKASVLGLKRPRGARRHFHRKWTDDMLRFLREEAPGRTRSGLAQVFQDRFGWLPSEAQLSNAMARAGAHVGTNTGRFRCGQVPMQCREALGRVHEPGRPAALQGRLVPEGQRAAQHAGAPLREEDQGRVLAGQDELLQAPQGQLPMGSARPVRLRAGARSADRWDEVHPPERGRGRRPHREPRGVPEGALPDRGRANEGHLRMA